jgi:hypothetical protein
MELKDYTTEELKAELKRRAELAKAQRAEEMKTAMRCRNCKHCAPNPRLNYQKICLARTWGKKYPRNYTVSPSKQACEKFERKEE